MREPPSRYDPISRFEPRWATPFAFLWMGGLVAIAVARRMWPEMVSYWDGVALAVLWIGCFIPFAALAYTIAFLRRERLARAEDQGRCVHCGYDVRANPARCPECGAEIAARPAA